MKRSNVSACDSSAWTEVARHHPVRNRPCSEFESLPSTIRLTFILHPLMAAHCALSARLAVETSALRCRFQD
jgi:hypothetical protein